MKRLTFTVVVSLVLSLGVFAAAASAAPGTDGFRMGAAADGFRYGAEPNPVKWGAKPNPRFAPNPVKWGAKPTGVRVTRSAAAPQL